MALVPEAILEKLEPMKVSRLLRCPNFRGLKSTIILSFLSWCPIAEYRDYGVGKFQVIQTACNACKMGMC